MVGTHRRCLLKCGAVHQSLELVLKSYWITATSFKLRRFRRERKFGRFLSHCWPWLSIFVLQSVAQVSEQKKAMWQKVFFSKEGNSLYFTDKGTPLYPWPTLSVKSLDLVKKRVTMTTTKIAEICLVKIAEFFSFFSINFRSKITLKNWSTQKPKPFDCWGVNHHTSSIV